MGASAIAAIALAYFAVASLVSVLAWIVSDPYRHRNAAVDWDEALLAGALWPLLFVYLLSFGTWMVAADAWDRQRKKKP